MLDVSGGGGVGRIYSVPRNICHIKQQDLFVGQQLSTLVVVVACSVQIAIETNRI